MENLKISILLPVFNGAAYLERCIGSLVSQDYFNYEIIVGDDSSSDTSLSIVNSFLSPKIIVVKNDFNLGLFKNLNKISQYASGDILRLFGQDDVMLPNCLSVEAAHWRSWPEAGYMYCGRDILDDKNIVSKDEKIDSTPLRIPCWLANQISYYWGPLAANISNSSISKSAFMKVGGFNSEMTLAGDWDLYSRLQEIYPVGRIPDKLVLVRDHSGQLSRKKGVFLKFCQEQKIVIDRLFNHFPPELRKQAFIFSQKRRLRQIFHHSFRCFIGCDFDQGLKVLKYLSNDSALFLSFYYWLFSLNGRIAQKNPSFKEPV